MSCSHPMSLPCRFLSIHCLTRLLPLLLALALLWAPAAASAADWTWKTTGSLHTGRYDHTATLLQDGRVLVAGGLDQNGQHQASAEIYDPGQGTWTIVKPMTTPRAQHTATLLQSGKVLVVAGDATSQTAEIYDPNLDKWTTTASLITARDFFTATLLADGKVLVAGGRKASDHSTLTSCELFNPSGAGSWSASSNSFLNFARYDHTALLLPDNEVLVVGGYNNVSGDVYWDETFIESFGTWTARNYLSPFVPIAAILTNGLALETDGVLCKLYNWATESWSNTGSLNTNRTGYFTASPLANGRVLVAGGNGGGLSLANCEIYDPAKAAWSNTVSLHMGRARHTAVSLPDGRVLVVGGIDSGFNALASAEVYGPARGNAALQLLLLD